MVDFGMQFIEFQNSSILKQKFIDFGINLENIGKKVIKNRSSREECGKRIKDLECHSRKYFLLKKIKTLQQP